MNDGQLLLRAVLDHPHDDTARLVYADWLDEQGRGARAEFIRVQIELAGLVPVAETTPPISTARAQVISLHTRADVLLHLHREWLPFDYVWMDGGSPADVIHCGRRGGPELFVARGFVGSVTCSAADWINNADAVLSQHPITKVKLFDVPEFAADSPFRVSFGGRLGVILAGKSLGLEIPEGEDAAKAFLEARWPGVEFELPAPADWQD